MDLHSIACRLLESRTFEFQVGKAKQSFFVYASAFKGNSDRLDAFIHGVLAKRRAVLPDVNPDVFLAACAYAYTGRYEVPSPEKIYGSGLIEPIRQDSSVQRNILPQLNRGELIGRESKKVTADAVIKV